MLKTSISILSLFILGCNRPFPLEHVYVVDVAHSVCAKKEIVDKEKLIFKHIEDLPLKECDGNVSIAKSDFPELKNWILWAIEKAKECRNDVEKLLRMNAKLSNDNRTVQL